MARLRETGNPQALQEQLGHTTAKMTLRYLKTLTADEARESTRRWTLDGELDP